MLEGWIFYSHAWPNEGSVPKKLFLARARLRILKLPAEITMLSKWIPSCFGSPANRDSDYLQLDRSETRRNGLCRAQDFASRHIQERPFQMCASGLRRENDSAGATCRSRPERCN